MHEVLVNRLGGLSLPRKSVVRLTDRPDMTLDVYRGRKTTIQQQQINQYKTAKSPTISEPQTGQNFQFNIGLMSHEKYFMDCAIRKESVSMRNCAVWSEFLLLHLQWNLKRYN